MLVVLIIGIVTSMAVYSMSPAGPSRESKREAQSLMASLDYAQQQAVLTHQPYGLMVGQHGYEFFVYQSQWQPVVSKTLNSSNLRSTIQLIKPNNTSDGSPNIVLMPSKEPQVFEIQFSLDGYHWLLANNALTGLKLTASTHE